jgi:hypothetical protein
MATLADCLSRESTTHQDALEVLVGVHIAHPWGKLGSWLENPVLDWYLPKKILGDVISLCEK